LAGDTVVTAVFTASDRDNDGIPDHLDAFPDDQRYNDDGDNDGMPSIWEARYGLNPAIDDAAMDSDGDGLSNINEFIKGTDPLVVTDGPGIAVLEAPDDFATERPLTPTLDVGYTNPAFAMFHDRTCWEIAKDAEFTMDVLKVTSPTFKTQITVPQGVLDEESTYYWRVHYIDTDGVAWAWSVSRSFTTSRAPYTDANGNGIPDSQEVPIGSGLDLDEDTVDDLTQGDMYCLELQVGSGQVGLKHGEQVDAVASFAQVDANTIDDETGRPVDLPVGLFNFRIVADTPGAVVTATMYFSEPLPDDMVWYKYDSLNGWHDYSDYASISDDRKSVVLELMDGGYGDADGVANGVVVDPSGPGSIMRSSSSTDSSSSGGCFIDTAFGCDEGVY